MEEDIDRLQKQYGDFRDKITKLVNDFKDTASKLEEGEPLDEPVLEEESDIGRKEISEEIIEESKEEKGIDYSLESEDEFEVFKDEDKLYRREEFEEEPEEKQESEGLGEDESEIEGEKEEEGEQETRLKRGFHEGSEEIEENRDDYQPKRMKKKIDIANPDIINDFFKTDED